MFAHYICSFIYDIVSEEIDMTKNLAGGKPTEQSYTADPQYSARGAVDGRRNTEHLSCSAPGNKDSAWWQVDLEAVYDIRVVALTGVPACCGKPEY